MPELTIFDTSALGRVVDALGDGDSLQAAIASGRAAACLMVLPEARSVINTKLRRGLPAQDAEAAWAQLQAAVASLDLLDIEVRDYWTAQELMERHPQLTASDAIHLAVATHVAKAGVGVTFVTADRHQAEVAGTILDAVRLVA